ncbi:MAG: IPT/TIG domain-containing protein [Acidobacteria bacterium]|nr:IPT/TIG domain-containing protein [Acidobacteriota bacterium]
MRKTATLGTMYPRVKVRLNSSSGTSLCNGNRDGCPDDHDGRVYHHVHHATANVTMSASDRLYVWAGVNLTAGSSAGAFRGELGVEGTLDGATNSRVIVPTALPAPSIATLTPTAGPVGQVVRIAGNNFRDQQLSSTVKFYNNRTASITNWSNTSITATVPASAVTGSVTVTVAGTASAGVTFQVGVVPVVNALTPAAELPGASVVITGSNFGATKGASTVRFNGLVATTSAWSATSITATVPTGATTGNVVVTVGGIASTGVLFTVPTLSSISVTPVALTVPRSGQQQYRAWGHYSDSVTRDVTAAVTWASTDSDVATIAAGGLATVTGTTGLTTLSATLGSASGATDLTAAPSPFKVVGSLKTRRVYHTATLLPNGTVLIAGGQDGAGVVTATAEIYDPATGRFLATGSMLKRRELHTATLLLDGTVLITGGLAFSPDEFHSTAEIYNPATGTFSTTGNMGGARYFHSATRLPDGRVLIDSGQWTFPPPPSLIYDPVARTFAATGAPTVFRSTHPAEALLDGRVLFAGAYGDAGAIAEADVFDPTTGGYSPTTGLSVPRSFHTSTRLSDGRVLVVGGGDACASQCTAEVYDSAATGVTPVGPLSVGRTAHTATVLGDGRVLVVGGQTPAAYTGTAELFDAATSTFTSAGGLTVGRSGHTATRLQDDSVLFVGGVGPLAGQSAELYVPLLSIPLDLVVTPSTAVLEVGASRIFTAVDHLGHPRLDAVWSSTSGSIATVDPATGVVTAVAGGTATITATIGAVSGTAQVTVAVGPVPVGTPVWTVGAPPGTTSRQLVSTSGGGRGGPSFIAISAAGSDTELQALSADGQQQWRTWITAPVRQVVPNSSGGVLLTLGDGCGTGPLQLLSIDGPTGIWAWNAVATNVCTPDAPQIAVRHDGAVAVVTPGNVAGFPNTMMLHGETGTPLAMPAIPQSTFTDFTGQQVPGYSRVGPPMVDANGTTHLLYEKRVLAYPPQVVNTGIWLMSVQANQTWTTTQLTSTSANTNLFPGRIIPDGAGGLIVSWIDSPIVPAGQPPAQSRSGRRGSLPAAA